MSERLRKAGRAGADMVIVFVTIILGGALGGFLTYVAAATLFGNRRGLEILSWVLIPPVFGAVGGAALALFLLSRLSSHR